MSVFNSVNALRPGRSVHDLSYSKLFTCDMGQLIPVMCDEVVPGDHITLDAEAVVRLQPQVAPILHEVNCYIHYFFIPYRILWDGWEDFITGGKNGDDASVLPRWNDLGESQVRAGLNTLWDYLGFPTGVDPIGAYPLDFPRRAYYKLFNEYYRDPNFMDELAIDNLAYYQILNCCWEKDYFTSALPWQQRGIAPSLPIAGVINTSAIWGADLSSELQFYDLDNAWHKQIGTRANASIAVRMDNDDDYDTGDATDRPLRAKLDVDDINNNNVEVDLSEGVTFNVSDLRVAFQLQKWLERNARAGYRYTEFLHAHYGVAPRDDRLQRPEFIGGCRTNVIISEVLQTSGTTVTSPQGNMAGHGMAIVNQHCGSYLVKEFGLIMGIMSVKPKPMYSQGINRQWLRRTRYDFYSPEFACLSEQAIENAEIYAEANGPQNIDVFGYQGRFDEMRYKPNQVCGLMRTSDFNFWHFGRIFDSLPDLNAVFVACSPTKRPFAAPSQPCLIVSFANIIKAVRPIPISSEPGMIDHNGGVA